VTGSRLATLGLAAVLAVPAAAGTRDRAAFRDAEAARLELLKSDERRRSQSNWERVIRRYQLLVHEFPRSGYADNALLAVGDLSREVAQRFRSPHHEREAVKAYRLIVSEYPSSSLCEEALYSAFLVDRGSGRDAATPAAQEFLERYPGSEHAAAVRRYLKGGGEVRTSRAAQAAEGGPVALRNLRFWSGDSSTRVVLDLAGQVRVEYDRLHGPERLYLDLIGTRLSDSLTHRAFPVGDGLLDQIRVGQNRPDAVRVVLDFKTVRDYSIFYLADPARLVIDVHGDEEAPAPLRAESGPAPSHPEAEPEVATVGAPDPPGPVAVAVDEAAPDPERERRADIADLPAPEPPSANSGGSYSIARQLGLGARRIVIDPGHGGRDPGTIGHGGLREKDVVLDVALRLEKLLRSELGAEVIMTRRDDVFIPLEERTAIANSEDADLFLSIHVNSAPSRNARGIETYYLSFAADRHAEEVAARENAISRATLKDLEDLVKGITLNSKIDESRDFAKSVQGALVGEIRPHYGSLRDRGVRTAPFYVLIGANMPSVLAELAFISNPTEAQHLSRADHRQLVARSLCVGVAGYLEALNRTQTRQLTASSATSKVDSGKGSR